MLLLDFPQTCHTICALSYSNAGYVNLTPIRSDIFVRLRSNYPQVNKINSSRFEIYCKTHFLILYGIKSEIRLLILVALHSISYFVPKGLNPTAKNKMVKVTRIVRILTSRSTSTLKLKFSYQRFITTDFSFLASP